MVERTPKQASYKRIVICSDGTWLASDVGDNSSPSNVAKLCRAVATSGPDAEGNIVKQVVYYHSGLGSGDLPLQKAIYGELLTREPFSLLRLGQLCSSLATFFHRRHRLGP